MASTLEVAAIKTRKQYGILVAPSFSSGVDLVDVSQKIYIKNVLTHAEYDKDEWKNDPYF